MAKRGGKTGGGTPLPNTVPDDVVSKLIEKQKEAMEALRKEMQDFSEQSSKSFEIAAAAAALFGDKLGSAAEKSETSSQSLDGLTNSLKKMGKAQDDAAKSAGFKKKGGGQDGQSNIFAQIDQSSKKAKVSVTAFGVAVQGLGKIFKALTSFIGGAFDVIKGIFSFIADVAMGIFDFFKGIYEGLFEMAQEQRKYATENRRAAEEIRENFGDISKGTGKAVLDFGKSLASASIAGLGAMQVFENAAEAIRFANEVASAAPAAFDKLQDQFKGQRGANIVGFAKGLGISTEQLGGLMRTAIATGRTVEGLGTEMTKYSKGLSSRFGVDSKLISKSMTKAMLDVKHFANATVKEIGQAAVYAHKLGVELSDITGILDAFDTFDQAAENVSKLSQAFGVNIDTMELVSAKTPADALAKVKAALDAAGKSADQMNRQELKLLASTVGMDEATVRQTLSNKNQGTSLENIKEAGNSVEKQMMSTGQALKEVSQDIKQVVRELQTQSKGFFETFLDGFYEGVATSSDMRKVLGNLQQAIDAVFAAGKRLGAIFVESFPGVKKMLEALASFFNPAAVGGMFNGFTDVFGKFFGKLKSGTGDVKNLFSDLWEEIKQYFTKQGPAGSEFIQGITEFWNAVKQIAATAITAMGDLIADAFTAIADAIEHGVDTSSAKSAAGKLLAGAKKEFSPIGDAFMNAFNKIRVPFMKIIDQMMTYLGDKLRSFFAEYKWEIALFAFGGSIINVLGSSISAVLSNPTLFSKFASGISSAISSIGPTMSVVFSNPITAAAAAAAAVIAGAFVIGINQIQSEEDKKKADKEFQGVAKQYHELKAAGRLDEAVKLITDEREKQQKLKDEELDGAMANIARGMGYGNREAGLDAAARVVEYDRLLVDAAGAGKNTYEKELAEAKASEKQFIDNLQKTLSDKGLKQFQFSSAKEVSDLASELEEKFKNMGSAGVADLPESERRQYDLLETLRRGVEPEDKLTYQASQFAATTSRAEVNIKASKEKDSAEQQLLAKELEEQKRKKDLAAADEMFKKTSAEMGLTTVDNVEERIKKIQDIGKKLAGGKDAFEKSMNTIRETLSSMNFSLWTNTKDEEKFKLSLVGLTQISTFTNTITTVVANLDKAGDTIKGMGDAKSGVVGKFISAFSAFKTGFSALQGELTGEKTKFTFDDGAFKDTTSNFDRLATNMDTIYASLGRIQGPLSKMPEALQTIASTFIKAKQGFAEFKKQVDAQFLVDIKQFGVLVGDGEGSLFQSLGKPADMTGLEEKATAWGNSVAEILETVSESLSADITKSINELLTSLAEFNTKMGEALAGGITANIPVKVETDAAGKMKVANPAKTITSPNGQMKMEFHFKIEMNARELEKILVTPNDSIIVTTFNEMSKQGPGATATGIQNQGIQVTKGTPG